MESIGWSRIIAATPLATTNNIGWLVTALVIALILSSLTSASETALTSVNQIRIKNLAEEGDEQAKQIIELLKTPNRFLTSILVTNNVALIVASSLATIIALNIEFPEALATLMLSLISLVFCEVAPKSAAVQNAETWARSLVSFVRFLTWMLRPVIMLINGISMSLLRLLKISQRRVGPSVTEEELMLLVNVGEQEGILEEDERRMFHSIFALGETTAREAMVPRIDMITLDAEISVLSASDTITQGGVSRIPVFDETIDNIIGVLYAKDILRELRLGHDQRQIREIVRPASFVPESKKLDDLLQEMRKNRIHMAIVSDEYGSVAGLVTIEDLIEEIVGDIQDEYDREEMPLFEKVNASDYIVDAIMNLDDFNELLGTELEAGEEYDTVGGFVLAQLDKIPVVGDTVSAEGVSLVVLSTKGRRVLKVRAHLKHPGEHDVSPQPELEKHQDQREMHEPPPTLSRLLSQEHEPQPVSKTPSLADQSAGQILPFMNRRKAEQEEEREPIRATVNARPISNNARRRRSKR